MNIHLFFDWHFFLHSDFENKNSEEIFHSVSVIILYVCQLSYVLPQSTVNIPHIRLSSYQCNVTCINAYIHTATCVSVCVRDLYTN